MGEKTCKNSAYFRLHYIRYGRGKYSSLHYGHCIKPRLKKRGENEKACVYWREKNAEEE